MRKWIFCGKFIQKYISFAIGRSLFLLRSRQIFQTVKFKMRDYFQSWLHINSASCGDSTLDKKWEKSIFKKWKPQMLFSLIYLYHTKKIVDCHWIVWMSLWWSHIIFRRQKLYLHIEEIHKVLSINSHTTNKTIPN